MNKLYDYAPTDLRRSRTKWSIILRSFSSKPSII